MRTPQVFAPELGQVGQFFNFEEICVTVGLGRAVDNKLVEIRVGRDKLETGTEVWMEAEILPIRRISPVLFFPLCFLAVGDKINSRHGHPDTPLRTPYDRS